MISNKLIHVSIRLAVIILVYVLSTSNTNAETIDISVFPMKSITEINPTIIRLNGKIYTDTIWIDDIITGKVQAESDENFIARVLTVNQSGSAADVLSTWNPDERTQMSTYINKPELFVVNKNWNKSIKYSAFLAKVLYGEYTVFVVQHIIVIFHNHSPT